ncbi:MAG TPA: ISNCY family transposase [Atribacteraceae bacterium]|nr:ISNCY family transposase [Atribacteraceae bacterium]
MAGGGLLALSRQERTRLVILARVQEKKMTIRDASRILGISYRHTRRIVKRYREEGDAGLIHRRRGQPSPRAKPLAFKQKVLDFYQKQYAGFGPTLAAEKLTEEDHCPIDHETLRRWLLAQGLWKRTRKSPQHRQRRMRKEHFGELVQLDGSHHDWFENREKACLMDLTDDATGKTLGHLEHEETTRGAMLALWSWILRYGIPRALYVDWKNVYLTDREPTLDEQLAGAVPLTQFGRACQKLDITIIPASSPQAKGRVERKHGVYQDRLVKEFRLRGVKDIEAANRLLPAFADTLNARFAKAPGSPVDYHRPLPPDCDLTTIFCLEEERTVSNDWVVRYHNRLFQVLPQSWRPPAKQRLTVQEQLDGTIHLVYRGKEVKCTEITQRPTTAEPGPLQGQKGIPHTGHVPPPDHPWRKQRLLVPRRKKPAEKTTPVEMGTTQPTN